MEGCHNIKNMAVYDKAIFNKAQERCTTTMWSDFIYYLFSSVWSIQEVFTHLQMIVVIWEQILTFTWKKLMYFKEESQNPNNEHFY